MIETRRASHARRRFAARRARVGTTPRPGLAHWSFADGRTIRAVLAGTGLAGLLGATACAVASVSAWLVPAYLLFVVVILAMPRGQRSSSTAPDLTARTAGADIAEPDLGSGTRQADGTGSPEPRFAAGRDPDLESDETDDSGPAHLRLDPAENAIAKPRRSRARSRKTAKSAVEPTVDSAPVTWIRVGPGQYVRSDTVSQGQPPVEAPAPAEVQAVESAADPATDSPEPATAAPTDTAEATPSADAPEADAPTSEESATDAHPATDVLEAAIPTPEADATEAHPATDLSEPVPTVSEVVADTRPPAEEYGIAPSAFGTTSPELDPAESRDPVVPDPVEPISPEPELEPGHTDSSAAAVTGCLADEPGEIGSRGADAPGCPADLGARRRRPVRLPTGRVDGDDGRGRMPASSRGASPT